jgi:hypothetical protein
MSHDTESLLAEVSNRYASCLSYRDEGEVTTTFWSPEVRVRRRPFRTRFIRPDRFYFEFRERRGEDHWDRYAVWLDKGRAQTFWSKLRDIEPLETLGRAIAGATGVSGGSAYAVPRLLLPDVIGDRPLWNRDAAFVDDAEADQAGCVVIELPLRSGEVERIWIDRASKLIRRIVEPRHLQRRVDSDIDVATGSTDAEKQLMEHVRALLKSMPKRPDPFVESVITYQASLNADIDDTELVFDQQGD